MADLARLLARLREVGVGGVTRRLRWRAGARAREVRAVSWARDAAAARSARVPRFSGELLSGTFFMETRDPELPKRFRERYAPGCERIVADAERALAGDLAWVVPGGSPDWHRALPGKEQWPLEEHAIIEREVGAEQPRGDVRLAWEVGRCTHAVRLAQAAWLTGEVRFASAARDVLFDFARTNPPGLGIAWFHAQEAALRTVHWLWVLHLLRGAGALDQETCDLSARQLALHGAFVEAFRSDGPSTHNHLMSEAGGLLVLGTAAPGLPGAARWRRLGARILAREILKQTHPDGPTGEGSTHYHAFVLDTCVAACLLAERGGPAFASSVTDRVARMTDYVHALIRADGTLPAIGDSDAGRAWRLGTDPLDRRDLLCAAAVWRKRSDWGSAAGDAPGAFWLTGGRPVPGVGAAPRRGGAVYRRAGVVVARAEGDAEEIAVFRAGTVRFLPDVLDAHHHADALSVLLRVGGEDVLVDPGTYLYSEGKGWRAAFRGTASHSCVVADGRDQADVSSARFGLFGLRPARWIQDEAKPGFLAACAEHARAGGPVLRRTAAWVERCGLVLLDAAPQGGAGEVSAWLQLPAAEVEREGEAAMLRLASGRVVRIDARGPGATLRIAPTPDGPGVGWRAPRYGVLQRGTAVRVSARLGPSDRLLTIVQTVSKGERAAAVTIDGAGTGSDLRVRIADVTLAFSLDGRVRLDRSATSQPGVA